MDWKKCGRSPHFAGFHLTFTTSHLEEPERGGCLFGAEVISRNRRVFESKIAIGDAIIDVIAELFRTEFSCTKTSENYCDFQRSMTYI